MGDKFTSVRIEDGRAYAITIDGDTGRIEMVDAVALPTETKDPDKQGGNGVWFY